MAKGVGLNKKQTVIITTHGKNCYWKEVYLVIAINSKFLQYTEYQSKTNQGGLTNLEVKRNVAQAYPNTNVLNPT